MTTPATTTPAAAPEAAAPAPGAPAPNGQPATPPTETPTPEPKPEKEEVGFATRFAALSKKEKALLDQQRSLKAERESEDYKGYLEYKKAKGTANDDPTALLKAHGWDYSRLTEFYLNDKKPTAEEKIEKLQKRLDDEAKRKDEDAKKAAETEAGQVIAQTKSLISDHIKKNGEALELSAAYGDEAVELVMEAIEEHFRQTSGPNGEPGEILPIDKAAQAVEDWLENEARAKILKTKKFQPKQEPTPETTTPDAKPETRGPPPTLTNKAVAGAPNAGDSKNLSAEELHRKAVAALRWK